MSLEYFIIKRLVVTKGDKSTISAPIIKIAVTAIVIGLIMMIASVATGVGLQQKIREKVIAFNGHIVLNNYDNNESEVSVFPISTKQDFYPKFNNVQGISHIQGIITKAGIIRTEDSFEGIIFKGVGKDFLWEHIENYIVAGRKPDFKEKLNAEILISRFLANRLKLKLGDKFNTFFMKDQVNQLPNLRVFQIIGIYDSGMPEFDASYILGDIRHLQRINKWAFDQVGAFEIFIDNFNQIEQKGQEIYNEIPSTIDANTIINKYQTIFQWLDLFDFNIMIILIIMIVVATINMVVALLVLILERTQMIGILKALGANNWMIRKIFLYNAFYLIIRGLFLGNIIAMILLLIQKYFGIIKLNPENYYVTEVPIYIDWKYILGLNLGTIIICLLVLLIPSYIITKISLVKAIRFD